MALLTPIEYQMLHSWSFLKDYNKNQSQLVDIARVVYAATEKVLGQQPVPADCEEVLKQGLLKTNLWNKILHSKSHLLPTFYDALTMAMAHFLLDNDWNRIK